jgi:pantetheine-phosphate adenylyltransferase
MKRIAVFPGSFDPFTIGHESIIRRSMDLFDEIIIAIGVNSQKQSLYSLEQRLNWIQKTFDQESKIRVDSYQGMTIDYCTKSNAKYILRGLRTSSDFEFERGIAQMNYAMQKDLETVFIISSPEHSAINSTIVRDIIRNGGNAQQFVPKEIELI